MTFNRNVTVAPAWRKADSRQLESSFSHKAMIVPPSPALANLAAGAPAASAAAINRSLDSPAPPQIPLNGVILVHETGHGGPVFQHQRFLPHTCDFGDFLLRFLEWLRGKPGYSTTFGSQLGKAPEKIKR